MKEYPMENSDGIWQCCGAGKKLFKTSKIHPMADGFTSVAKIGSLVDGSSPNIISKGKQCIDNSALQKSSATFERIRLNSTGYCRDMCFPFQDSIEEVDPFQDGDLLSVIRHHASSSGTKSDTMSDHPHGDSGPGGPFLLWPLGISDENSVKELAFYEKKKPSKSRVWRRCEKAAVKQNRLFSDEGMKGSSAQYAACNREPSVEASSSRSISNVLAEDMELQSRNINGEICDLRLVDCCETGYNCFNQPCHPPARKKSKISQSFISETSTRPSETENQKGKSEILFPGLHPLADVAVRLLENDVVGFPENSLTEKEGFRKAIFIPTGVPFCRRVVRRAKSAFKQHQFNAQQMLHALEKSPSGANSEPLLTVDNISKLGDPACIKQSENQVVSNGVNEDPMAIPHVRRSKRIRSQALPSKYCDFVLQSWKRDTRS